MIIISAGGNNERIGVACFAKRNHRLDEAVYPVPIDIDLDDVTFMMSLIDNDRFWVRLTDGIIKGL